MLTCADWYHDQTPTLLHQVFDKTNVQVRPPIPQSCLINDAKHNHYEIQPGKKYKFRIINMSAYSGAAVFIDGHPLTVVEIDGIYTEPTEARQLYISPGQRYSVIVEGREDACENYAVNVVLDMTPEILTPIPQLSFPVNATAVLRYDEAKPDPQQTIVDEFDVLDDITLKVCSPAWCFGPVLTGEAPRRHEAPPRAGSADRAGLPPGPRRRWHPSVSIPSAPSPSHR